MRYRWCCAVAAVLCFAAGCARHAPAPKPVANPTATIKATVPLPEWAPKHPSPEFLRAAKVLKPVPREATVNETSNLVSLTDALRARMERILYPASYQFFGTLDDAQIEHFLAEKKIRLPVRTMTEVQRQALGSWFDAFAATMKGGPTEYADMRVVLYRLGARQDLSNVDAGFVAVGGHAVHIQFWVRRRDGKEPSLNSHFAEI